MNLDTLYLTSVALLAIYDVVGVVLIAWAIVALRKLNKGGR